VEFVIGLPFGHGLTAEKTNAHKAKSGLSKKYSSPMFNLLTDASYISITKNHRISGPFFSMINGSANRWQKFFNFFRHRSIAEIGGLDLSTLCKVLSPHPNSALSPATAPARLQRGMKNQRPLELPIFRSALLLLHVVGRKGEIHISNIMPNRVSSMLLTELSPPPMGTSAIPCGFTTTVM
jgi:hypothetical protein